MTELLESTQNAAPPDHAYPGHPDHEVPENGAVNTQSESPADRPRTKTTACRVLVRDGIVDSKEIIRLAKERWNYDVNATDASNAKKTEEREKAKRAEERRQKRQQQSQPTESAGQKPDPRLSSVLCELCVSYGLAAVRKTLDSIEKDVNAMLRV